MFYTDVGGDGNFGNQQGSLTLSGILPMGGSGHMLSAGIQGGYGQRSVNVGSLTFNSQWNGSGFDATQASGEANLGNSFAYIDASGGILYQFDGGQSTFARNNQLKFQLGVSGYHLNAPELKYSSGVSEERLARKFVAHSRVIAEVAGSKWSVDGSVAQFIQGGHYETILGGMARYRFENGTKITGLSHDAFLAFGAYFRVRDAIIPAVMLDWRGFQFGVSYDVTVSQLRNVNSGSLEFSLAFRNMHDALFKTKRRRF
jgi:type IX secretion system PorP/SprF family membrane protein